MINKIKNQSAWSKHPDYKIDIKPDESHISVILSGDLIADSQQTLLVQEQDHQPVVYFPRQDVRMEWLISTTKTSFCPFKGTARHWSLDNKDQHIEVAAWSYEDPFPQVNQIKNYIAFYPEVFSTLKDT